MRFLNHQQHVILMGSGSGMSSFHGSLFQLGHNPQLDETKQTKTTKRTALYFGDTRPGKLTWLAGKWSFPIYVFLIEHGDFPVSHVSLPECISLVVFGVCHNHLISNPKKLEKPCITKGQHLAIFRVASIM